MTGFVLLDVCPICFGGPVVQGDKWLVGAFSITKPFVCAQCGSVLRSLKGGRYRYTAVSSEHAEWAHLQESNDAYWFGSLQPLEAWLAELSAAFEFYGEACANNDDSLVEEGNRHLVECEAYGEQTVEAMRQCGGE